MLGISGRRWNQLPNFQHFTSFFSPWGYSYCFPHFVRGQQSLQHTPSMETAWQGVMVLLRLKQKEQQHVPKGPAPLSNRYTSTSAADFILIGYQGAFPSPTTAQLFSVALGFTFHWNPIIKYLGSYWSKLPGLSSQPAFINQCCILPISIYLNVFNDIN